MITETTGISLGLLAAFGGVATGAIALFAVMRYRLGRVEKSTARRMQAHAGRLRVLEDWKLQQETAEAVRRGDPLPARRAPTGPVPVSDTVTGFGSSDEDSVP